MSWLCFNTALKFWKFWRVDLFAKKIQLLTRINSKIWSKIRLRWFTIFFVAKNDPSESHRWPLPPSKMASKDLQLVINDLRWPFKSYFCHIDDEKLAGDLEFEENVACRLSVWSVFLFYYWLSQVNLTFLTLFDLIWPSQVRLNTFVSRVATVFSVPE